MGFFDGLLGGVVSGVGNLVGGILGNEQRDEQADQTNAMSAQEAAANRQFQGHWLEVGEKFAREMSNSAYQRQMADMQLAGLNPILAAKVGGASTPQIGTASGSMPSFQTPQVENVLGPAVSSAVQTYEAVNRVEQLKAQVGEREANTALLLGQAGVQRAQEDNLRAHTARTIEEIPNAAAQRRLWDATSGREAATVTNLGAQTDLTRGQTDTMRQFGRPGMDPGSIASQLGSITRMLGEELERLRGGRSLPSPSPGSVAPNMDQLRNRFGR